MVYNGGVSKANSRSGKQQTAHQTGKVRYSVVAIQGKFKMSDKTVVAKTEGKRGRAPGPGVISCDESKYPIFAKIWNETKATENEKRMDLILHALRNAGIANKDTDPNQVRAFATKVRNAGVELNIATIVRLDRFKIVAAWQKNSSPSIAFQVCLDKGVFGAEEGDTAKEKAEWRKMKLQSFRAVIAQLREAGVALKEMGKTRAKKIDSEKFAKIWNSCDSVADVKEQCVEAKLCSKETTLQQLKSKANTMRKGTEKVPAVEMKNLSSREDIHNLKKLAEMLAAGGEEDESNDNDAEEEEDAEEEDDDDDDEDREVESDDDLGDLA